MGKLSEDIIDSALKIHKALGPGLLESVYRDCLDFELSGKGFAVKKEAVLPVSYEALNFSTGFKADLIINDTIIIELKSVEALQPVHRAQTLTYLKLTNYPLALLINFGESMLKNGLHRFANGNAANDL